MDVQAGDAKAPGPKILMIDDVSMNLKVLSAMVKHLGGDPICCATPSEAFTILETVRPLLIMTDYWMPELTGAEFVARLANVPNAAGVPVVVVTADMQISDRGSENFFAVLHKPVTMERIREIIRRASGTPAAP